jgi:hypothetical protein
VSRILVFNDELPAKLAKALKADAKKRNVTMNDRANAILAERYAVDEFTSGAEYSAPSAKRFRLKVPEHLRDALAIEAAEKRATIRGITLNILASHYGLEPVETGRRPRSAS